MIGMNKVNNTLGEVVGRVWVCKHCTRRGFVRLQGQVMCILSSKKRVCKWGKAELHYLVKAQKRRNVCVKTKRGGK